MQQSALILPFPDVPKANDPYDRAKNKSEGLDRSQLERWLLEIKDQPEWRTDCNTDAAYYDGYQLDSATIQALTKLGFPECTENLIQPTIDLVLGMESKSRTDWIVKPDNSDKWTDVADAISQKLKEAERESHADDACSQAFSGMAITGISCVEIGKNIDPFVYPYRVLPVHRNEIAWDWKFRNPDQSDMRYFLRWKWFDPDALVAMFPRHESVIRLASGQWSQAQWIEAITTNIDLAATYVDMKHATTWSQEWFDRLRGRVLLTEVWYRVWKRGPVLKLPDGRTVEYNPKDKEHVAAVGYGLIKPIIAPYSRVRMSYWLGPQRLEDLPSPYPFAGFPYVLFFGYREDNTGRPYALSRKMRPQQDEVNARKMKMAWLLAAKRVIADEDAVDDHEEAKEEVARSDAYVVLSRSRRQDARFEVESDFRLTEEQFKVYMQARQAIQDVAGVYQALLGKAGAADSGVAINQLIDQGTTTLAHMMSNYLMSRRMVGQRLMELVAHDIGEGETVIVGDGTRKRTINLNDPGNDEFGPTIKNDVKRSKLKVVLDDVPTSATFREQTRMQLSEVLKSMPPEAQAIVAPWFMELTEFKDRHKVADILRKQMGMQVEPTNPEEAKEMEAAKQAQEAQMQLNQRAAEADVAQKEAEAKRAEAEANKANAEAQSIATQPAGGGDASAEVGAQLQQITEKHAAEMESMQKELDAARAKLAEFQANKSVERDRAILEHDAELQRSKDESAAKVRVADIEKKQMDVLQRFTKDMQDMKALIQKLLKGETEDKET